MGAIKRLIGSSGAQARKVPMVGWEEWLLLSHPTYPAGCLGSGSPIILHDHHTEGCTSRISLASQYTGGLVWEP